jgi:adenylate cyclase
MALNPNSAINFARKGYLEVWVGKFAAAEQSLRRAMRLSPLDLEMCQMLYMLAQTYTRVGRFEEGLSTALTAIRERPSFTQSYAAAARCLVALGRVDEAREFVARLLQISPGFTIEKFARVSPSRDFDPHRKEYDDALRLAGLPE